MLIIMHLIHTIHITVGLISEAGGLNAIEELQNHENQGTRASYPWILSSFDTLTSSHSHIITSIFNTRSI